MNTQITRTDYGDSSIPLPQELSKFSPEQLDEVYRLLEKRQIQNMMQSLSNVNDKVNMIVTAQLKMQQHITEVEKIAEKEHFIQFKKFSSDYVTMTSLGKENNPEISDVRMKKLLQWALILRAGNRTDPFADRMDGKEPLVQKSKEISTGGHEYWLWRFHNFRTWNIIKTKLNKEGLLNTFYACKTKSEIDKFIDNLS